MKFFSHFENVLYQLILEDNIEFLFFVKTKSTKAPRVINPVTNNELSMDT